jgi:hypothetical protein
LLFALSVRADALCSQATATINSQADATALASCSTISGSIVVGSTASGDISIDGPTEITGDLAVQNATEITSLSSSTIGTIGGTFTLDTLTLLSTLQFSALQTVETISWSALPNLGAITFPNGEITTSHITITNTFLSSLDGLATGVISTLDINNNPDLTSANFTITSITSSLNLAANGKATAFSFPQLHWAANITAKNCSQLNLPSISAVNGSLGLYGNSFTDFSAPTLLSVGNTATGAGSLAIISNTALTGSGLSMPLLQSVGGALQVTDNTALSTVSFPDLTDIGGAVVLTGSFST